MPNAITKVKKFHGAILTLCTACGQCTDQLFKLFKGSLKQYAHVHFSSAMQQPWPAVLSDAIND